MSDKTKLITKQIISKKRVINHGEVLTAKREVDAMLALIKHEVVRIDSRFLEPACGTGNFLAEVLNKKLETVLNRYSKSQIEFERYAITAISSIYGVDILLDNVQECKGRLLGIFTHYYIKNYKKFKSQLLNVAEYILERNIQWGDALSMKIPDAKEDPIVFSEWSVVKGGLIKRRDYTMANLLERQPFEGFNLFSDLGDKAIIPKTVAEFPLVSIYKLGIND